MKSSWFTIPEGSIDGKEVEIVLKSNYNDLVDAAKLAFAVYSGKSSVAPEECLDRLKKALTKLEGQ